MLTVSHIPRKMWPIYATLGVTLVLWIGSKGCAGDVFEDPYKYPAKAASLIATVLMCWGALLSARLRPLERFFGGLDQVYQVHKRIGRWAFFVILLHPLFLSAHNLPDLSTFFLEMTFRRPLGSRYLWGQNLGAAALLLMAVLMVLTLWVKLPYHRWKRSHELFGPVLFLVAAHVLVVDRDVAAYPILAIWVYAFLAAALASVVYMRFLYRHWGPRFPYAVSGISLRSDVLHLTLRPSERAMDFRPSQFVYLVVHMEGITPEPHPYSIACGYNRERQIKLGIKLVGDHTRTLAGLQTGDSVSLYGPYGRFSDRFLSGESDCVFIAGGIGITPFLGMWHVALHSEERLDDRDVPERLRRLHPEIIKTWKSPRVHLFYVCREPKDAGFDQDIRREVISSRFHGFRAFEERGHHYELWLTSEQGRVTAAHVDERVRGGVAGKAVFLCGPSPMVASLIGQLRALGLEDRHIVVEDFNLL